MRGVIGLKEQWEGAVGIKMSRCRVNLFRPVCE